MEIYKFTDYASRIQLPDFSQLVKNRKKKKKNNVTISQHGVTVIFFDIDFFSLVKFSYWSKFHFNIITGSGVMTILFNKGLTRNLLIGNTPV